MASNKTIQALSDFEHVRTRPTMYVGQIAKTDTKVPVLATENNNPYIKKKELFISPAFYKLYDEVLGNAFDEAIRVGGKMKQISIWFNSVTSEVKVEDTGGGFFKGTEINPKTNRTNIETAFTTLKAGSNFDDNREEELIGTNGVGVSLVNMLSEYFEVETTNTDYTYIQRWTTKDWENNRYSDYIIKKKGRSNTGTKIKFKPSKELFADNQWDKDYVHCLMTLKNFTKNQNPLLKKLKFTAYFDGEELDLNTPIFPSDTFSVESPFGKIWVVPKYQDGLDISFINGQLCEGIHQKIINDKINEVYGFQYAHWYYNTIVTFNLKPKLVQFADQNKTRFATGRSTIEPEIEAIINKLKNIKNSKVSKYIQNKIEEYEKINALRELKKVRKKASKPNAKFISKYYPPSGKKELLFLSEGLAASGGLIESRDTKTCGVYALKGKIKNVKTVTDLSESFEIAQLMNILGLELDKKSCTYEKVVIAVDADQDGSHIASLLINLFYKWFPFLIEEGRLFLLQTPIISVRLNGRLAHFYKKETYYSKKRTNVRDKTYIKGLGALDENDWKLIFKKMQLVQIYADRQAKKYLNIAFGNDASIRKKWLENKIS